MRRSFVLLCACVAVLGTAPAAPAEAGWKTRITELAEGRAIGIAVGDNGSELYLRRARVDRIPASNQKLLLSMAVLDRIGGDRRITTAAAIRPGAMEDGVIDGNLWVIGRGDPTVTSGAYGSKFWFAPTRLGRLAARIEGAGVTRITGRVMGGISYYAHDWWAKGWKSYFPSNYAPLATALSVNGNVADGRHISDPEKRAARFLTRHLRERGIVVAGRPGAGTPPSERERVASVDSAPLSALIGHMNRNSSNFFAEVLGKLVGIERFGVAGTIAKGARAIRRWASDHGVSAAAFDSSGLSYSNRVSARGLYRLLSFAERQPWGDELRRSLPRAGQGTLEDRLRDIRIRAKTGTLTNVSALSGWVWMQRSDSWAEFSILSSGMPKSTAVKLENRIVRIVSRYGR